MIRTLLIMRVLIATVLITNARANTMVGRTVLARAMRGLPAGGSRATTGRTRVRCHAAAPVSRPRANPLLDRVVSLPEFAGYAAKTFQCAPRGSVAVGACGPRGG